MTKGILTFIRHKNNLYKILCRNNFSNINQVKQYKVYRNKLTKKKVFKKKHQGCNKHSAETWKVMILQTDRKKHTFPH